MSQHQRINDPKLNNNFNINSKKNNYFNVGLIKYYNFNLNCKSCNTSKVAENLVGTRNFW